MPYHIIASLLICLGVVVTGCRAEDVSPQDRLASSVAYDSLLGEIPDSILAALPAIDSLFLAYGKDIIYPSPIDTAAASRWVDSVMSTLSLDEKIGQLFIIHLDRRGYGGLVDEAADAVRKFGVGGFLVPRLLDPERVFSETQRLQRIAKIPLFFAADYERGVGRFNNALTELPSNMALGATRDTLFAAAAGRLSAIEARALGINLLFAPVVDVNNNPDNPIINIRSYSEDPELVGTMAAAFVHEAQRHRLLTTLKHFPGHGNTSVDTHARMAVIRGEVAELEEIELKPYRIALGRPPQPGAVMSAHLWVPALEERTLPATFSRGILRDLLRDELNFEGIVITDDVQMGALSTHYSMAERIITPLLAGANVILTPSNLPQAVNAVRRSVQQRRLPEELIDESVRRILQAKAGAGLHEDRFADKDFLEDLLDQPKGAYIAQSIADRAVTLLKTAPALPLKPGSRRIAAVHLTNYRGSESINASIDLFDHVVGSGQDSFWSVRFDEDPSATEIGWVASRAGEADVIVLALYLRLQAGRGEAGLFPRQRQLVERLLELDKPVALLTFGNPYAVMPFQASDAILVAYDQALETAYAAAQVLLGRQPPRGRLPITVDPFPFGAGLLSLDDDVSNDR